MAELFRIRLKQRRGMWVSRTNHWFCYGDDLRNQIRLPADVTEIDIVAHSVGGADRFKCVITNDYGGLAARVAEIQTCYGGRRPYYCFRPWLQQILKRRRFRDGDVFYIQFEY